MLRPLRSVSKLPGLRKIILALMDSTKDLSNVMFLLAFLLVCFSITGMLFWKGILHARCRLTPFPVVLSEGCENIGDPCWQEYLQNVSTIPDEYRCLPDANDDPTWTQSTSPWFVQGPQDCIWPIDNDDERVCSLGKSGNHDCPALHQSLGGKIDRTCGSNYDAFGNPRFIDSDKPYGYSRMKSGNFIEGLNWGFTNYDSFLPAFLSTFQSITLEGWTDIMYQVMDAWAVAPTVIIFCSQVILCGYIVLNLVLAVITKSLDEYDDDNDSEADSGDVLNLTTILEEHGIPDGEGEQVAKRLLEEIMDGKIHSITIMICIVLNTIVLSIDHYGISEGATESLEIMNTCFTIIFIIDVILCNIAFGPRKYWWCVHLSEITN